MGPLEIAIGELRLILAADATAPEWRWHVRQRLSSVANALADPEAREGEAWLVARAGRSERTCARLRARVTTLAAGVLDRLEAGTILREARRLLVDVEHQAQARHDLVYDSVCLELGGSE